MTEPWWKSAVVYQIYPRSFCDTDGDGVGDLEGVRRHLDHLVDLGVDAIWLSPFYPSPMKDFGYDVSDYCDVDPLFGTLADFDRLVADAHAAGLRVVIDWVPNHTSSEHPWFRDARTSRTAAKRDWYIWRDGEPSTPPNNWEAAFVGGPAWTWDEATEQWYLHLFLPEQPDLNWDNPEVRSAMHDTLRFWLDRGVDGFRMDVIHMIGKDPALPDNPPGFRMSGFADTHPSTHEHLRALRRLLEEYDDDRMMVGEVFIMSTARVATFYGDGDELHLAFNFPPLFAPWEAPVWRRRIGRTEEELGPRDAWPSWVLSNHDVPRHRTRYGNEARARAAAVLLLTLRGTPFLYAGEELGLEDAEVPVDRVVDPGGRDGCRAPMPWTSDGDHGWATVDPWLPWPPEAEGRNADAQVADPDSMLQLYRRLLRARRGSAALRWGTWTALEAPDTVVAYERRHADKGHDDDRRVVLVSYAAEPVEAPVEGAWTVEVSSDGAGEGAPYRGSLGPEQAVLLRPAER